ncbi:helix-turn-helix domain-containing protein [Haloferacaceae archaeon DSL9]
MQKRSTDGLFARVAVRPPYACSLRQVSEVHTIHQFAPGDRDGHPSQIVLEPHGDLDDASFCDRHVEVITRLGDRIVCQLRCRDAHADADARCLAYGFGFLPIAPFAYYWRRGWVHLHFAAREYADLQRTVDRLARAGCDVDLRQVLHGGTTRQLIGDDGPQIGVIDLSALTDRQREVVEAAVEMGYFSTGGTDAEAIASRLDISKSTLSHHLRVVIRKILSQLFD